MNLSDKGTEGKKGTKMQRHKVTEGKERKKQFLLCASVPMSLCISLLCFVPMCLCTFVPVSPRGKEIDILV